MTKKATGMIVLIALLSIALMPMLIVGVMSLFAFLMVALPTFFVISSVTFLGFMAIAWLFFDWVFYISIGRAYGGRMIAWVRQEFPSFQPTFDRFLSFCNRHTKKTVFILAPLLIMAISWAVQCSKNKEGAFLLTIYWFAYGIRSFFIMLLGVKRMPLPAFTIFYYVSLWLMGVIGSWASVAMCPVLRQDLWLSLHGFFARVIG
jgi:hypothetical protein